MKNFLLFFVLLIAFTSCSRKTIPPATNTINNNNYNNNNNNVNANTDTAALNKAKVDSAYSINNIPYLVVTDPYGKIINSKQNIPSPDITFDDTKLSKGFTPQQLANLKTRYKTIPPRVLYVNPQNQQSSLRGSYYIYKKKFWYWKKSDGLFYLDTKYYE